MSSKTCKEKYKKCLNIDFKRFKFWMTLKTIILNNFKYYKTLLE